MNALRKVKNAMFPPPAYSEDGRAQWPSRTSFLLASMGGAMGFGNMLRYPSQVYNNNGLQWFIPYLMAITCLAIPLLILEIAIGQAHRSGTVISFNALDNRLRGVGLSMVFTGYCICVYYVPLLSWVWVYFRNSFQAAPFAWTGRAEDFFYNDVVIQKAKVEGEISGGSVQSYSSYPNTAVSGELIGWTILSWLIVWLCINKGVSITGRVVYFTIGLPIIMTVVLLGRAVSLDNAGRGIKLYFGEWHSDKLAGGKIWQEATGQVFYSTGVGFGYFTAYASYNSQFASAVQDSVIICVSNAAYEVIAAFIAFGVVGFMNMMPEEGGEELGTYSLGFLTYPVAIDQMPGAPFWAIVFFLTLILLGISSSYAMLDGLVTVLCDSEYGRKYKHVTVASFCTVVSCLLSFMFCTEFGYDLLNATDRWANNIALLFAAFCQVGWPAFGTYNFGYLGGLIMGCAIAHSVSAEAGAGAGFGLFIVCTIIALFIARTPDSLAPRFFGKNAYLKRFWWLAFYQGNQLRRDLNVTVAVGKNWSIPWPWTICLRYIGAPVLGIIFSFSYPAFTPDRSDSLEVWGFFVSHCVVFVAIAGFLLPRFLNILVPTERRGEGTRTYAPQVILGSDDIRVSRGVENGDQDSSGLESGSDKGFDEKMDTMDKMEK
ncbi:MAG: hypothetical protein LQ337_005508 [Flavoplaca oasis]|nr:MAG: hypothetical protein LQ337_005508 [Flavoplaca oasis]